jgi:formate hydrogenlyase transcriptional activator
VRASRPLSARARRATGTSTRRRRSPTCRLIRWNRRAEELTGYGPEQLRGVHFLDLGADSAAGKPQQQALYERFLAGEETVSELEGRRRDGGAFWIRSHVRPLRDASGAVTATQSVLVDITDRKRAEEALRESEERLSRVLSSAMDAIVTIDDAGRVELFNAAAEKVLGAPAGSAVGRPFATFLTPPLAAEIDRARAASSSYAWLPAGLRARRADRREFPVEGTISRVSVGGRRLHTLILRDVEERMRAEEQLKTLHSENVYLREEIEAFHHFDEIIGESPALQAVLRKIGLVAGTDSSVLILGETGTGKELVARAVHSNSRRRSRPLIKVNCAALPTGLVESELFGHEKGAFTGAHERRIGRFELADGGTIFLDEIGELSPEVQVKLLRVLQERQLERIGGTRTLDVDVRVIAATNRDLARAVTEGTFRQDLYYRLNVFPVVVPPLRERPEDIPLLVHYFVERYAAKIGRRIARVAPEAMRRLVRYAWPGNVRELENVVERAVILATGPELDVAAELLPGSAAAPPTAIAAPPAANDPASLEHVERSHIVAVLKRTNWRVDGPQGAARILDINPSTLRSRMQKLGIRRGAEELS